MKSNKSNSMKKTRWTSIKEDYLPWAIATIGIPFYFYGLWFQTNGFVYVDVYFCLAAAVLGGIVGFSLMRYTANQQNITLRDIASMMFGYEIATLLCFVITYVATTMVFFLVGVGTTAMGITIMWFYLALIIKDKKAKPDEH